MVEQVHSFSGEHACVFKFRKRHPSRPHQRSRITIIITILNRLRFTPAPNGKMQPSRSWRQAALLGLSICVSFSLFVGRACAEVDAVSVQRSINRGIAYLKKSQNDNGGWAEYGGQSCGLSALCTLALLNAGVSRDDPAMKKAIRNLRKSRPVKTYSTALQTLVLSHLGTAGDLPLIKRNVDVLVKNQKVTVNEGAWGYGSGMSSGDASNAQFAVLALGAAQDRGVKVPPVAFERALKYWKRIQNKSGGWGYGSAQSSPYGSMTCAGVASIIISRGRLSGLTSQVEDDKIQCCGSVDEEDPVAAGLEWLGKSFNLEVNPGGGPGTFFYYLYALERVGRLSGRRFIGEHDWYREGAQRLLDLQDDFEGFWSGVGWEGDENIATSFALLFLSKGKRQVVLGQLRYGEQAAKSADWQRHPDAMRQLVRHVERAWGRDLTWQTVDSQRARVVDLLQTPVLLISGRERLVFSDSLKKRLKQYIDQGGTIVFDADGGDGCGDASEFQNSVAALCKEWFENAKLDRLPPSHPVWFAESKVDINSLEKDVWVYGVQACCRTSVFYLPKSFSCRWELSDMLFRRSDENPKARKNISNAVRIGQNIIAYATGRELKDKLQRRTLLGGSILEETSRGAIRLASLAIDAGGKDARRALPNAAAIIDRRMPDLSLSIDGEDVGFETESLREVTLLWMHGRTEFQFDQQQRSAVAEFIKNGGVVLGSSICGNEAFTKSFRDEMKIILPESPLQIMNSDHPALTSSYDGFDIRLVSIRMPATTTDGQKFGKRRGPPKLEFATVDGVARVFYSPLDISCALESPNSVQCPGYDTNDAAKIVANLILYSVQQ